MSWEELVRLSEDIASSPLVPEISSDVQISLQYTTMMYTIYVLHVTYQELVRLSEDIVSSPLALVPDISSDFHFDSSVLQYVVTTFISTNVALL